VTARLPTRFDPRWTSVRGIATSYFRAKTTGPAMALARLRLQADLLGMKGTPIALPHLILEKTSRNKAEDPELDVSFGGTNGRE
jgi:hypothetical protein